jgi:hypothetical protein
MQYDHIRLAFSVVILGIGLSLIISDLRSRRGKPSSSPVQTVRFGPIEVSTTSLGLAIIALAIPIMLLSRISVTEAEQRGKEQLITPLFKAYQGSIDAYFDLQKKTVQNWIDQIYLPELIRNFDKELLSSQTNVEHVQKTKLLVQQVRKKEREMLSSLDVARDQLIQSANRYITEALRGDAKASLTTLDEQIAAKQKEVVREVSSMVEALSKIIPKLIP